MPPVDSDKTCPECGETKPRSKFRRGRTECLTCIRKKDWKTITATTKQCAGCGRRHDRRLYDSLKPGSRCSICRKVPTELEPLFERECPTCEQVLRIDRFRKDPHSRIRHEECMDCHTGCPRARCTSCGKYRHRDKFPEDMGVRNRRCNECIEDGSIPKADCIRYDYAFAKHVLELSHDQALDWVARGYGIEPKSVAHQIDIEFVWQPDPYIEEETVDA